MEVTEWGLGAPHARSRDRARALSPPMASEVKEKRARGVQEEGKNARLGV